MMILRTSLTSPFGRKALLGAHHLGLMDRIKVEGADPMEEHDVLRKDNPLGKMPALILPDGRRIFDSCVILEYFDHIAGGDRLLPTNFDDRMDALTLQALSDGIMDAAILIVYEGRHRPEALHHAPWLDYQRDKILRSLAHLAANPPDAKRVTVGTIATACMFGYLDWRKQVDWRTLHPSLVTWFDTFKRNCPAAERVIVTP